MSEVRETPFVNSSLNLLLQTLCSTWMDDKGYWRPLPAYAPDVAALKETLTTAGALSDGAGALAPSGSFVSGALYVDHGAHLGTHVVTLHLSVAAWQRLMVQWPAAEADGLAILARLAGAANRPGTDAVALTMNHEEWQQIGAHVASVLGPVPSGSTPATNDLGGLHAALADATGNSNLVIADSSPFDDTNRFAHFALAVNHSEEIGDGIVMSSAMYATLRTLWPTAVSDDGVWWTSPMTIRDPSGVPTGVVVIPYAALKGLSVSDWGEELVRRGIIDAGQIVHTAFRSATEFQSLAAFNDAVQRDAFTSSFITPEPEAFSFSEAARKAWLGQALEAATVPLQRAAAWLDQVRLALDSAPAQDGWVTLDTSTLALVDPAYWPVNHPLLDASLVLKGHIMRSISGSTLSGQLGSALRPGETLVIEVDGTAIDSNLIVVDSDHLTWSFDLTDDGRDGWRDVSVKRSTAGQSDVIVQRFAVLDQQASPATRVSAQSLVRWLGVGGQDLGQAVATLLAAAAAVVPGEDANGALSVVDIESLRGLLLDPALQRVLESQGLTLPDVPANLGLTAVADRIAANGLFIDNGQGLQATRETLLAWATQAAAGGGYGAAPAVPRDRGPGLLATPVRLLEQSEREALDGLVDATFAASTVLRDIHRIGIDAAMGVALKLNLPPGSTYTLETSTDGEHWSAIASLDAVSSLNSAGMLVRVTNVVLPDGNTHDTPLVLTAIRRGTQDAVLARSADILLHDPEAPSLTAQAIDGSAISDAGYAVFEVQLSGAQGDELDLNFQLEHTTPDGTVSSEAFEQLMRPPTGDPYWRPIGSGVRLMGLGSFPDRLLVLRHAVPPGTASETGDNLRLVVNASGPAAATLASTTVAAEALLVDDVPQAITIEARDVGQGEGVVDFQVDLARSLDRTLLLDLRLTADDALELGMHEYSLDGGDSWRLLEVDADGRASVSMNPGDFQLLLRSRVDGFSGIASSASVGLDVSARQSAPFTDVVVANRSTRVWRFDGNVAQMWVEDLRIDRAAGEAVFTVRLSGDSGLPVTVDYATGLPGDGTAADPLRDFFETSGRLVFEPGQLAQQVRVPLRAGWEQVADPRSFELGLSTPVNATLVDDRALATLQGLLPGLVVTGAVADEAMGGHASFQVGLTRALGSDVTLRLRLLGDDCDGEADTGAIEYRDAEGQWRAIADDGSLTLAAGQAAVLVRVALNPREAGTFEVNEQLRLQVDAAPGSAGQLINATANAPLLLRGNGDAPRVQAHETTSDFVTGGTFEIGLDDPGWVGLGAADITALREAMIAAGFDGALLDAAQHQRPDDSGAAVPVFATDWLIQLQRAIDLQGDARHLRSVLDDVVVLHDLGQTTTQDGVAAWKFTPDAGDGRLPDIGALIDTLGALGLPAQRMNSLIEAEHPLGTVLDIGLTGQVVVSAETLDYWAAELQRQEQRQEALALRARIALLLGTTAGAPVSIGTKQSDGSGSGERWLVELAEAGVPLLDISEGAYDPDAIGAIYRRQDADGVERMYVSEETLVVWGEMLSDRAALATSTYNGGLEAYGQTRLRDLARDGWELVIQHANFAKIRLAYAASTSIRNMYWLSKDLTIERLRQYVSGFYTDLNLFRQILPNPELAKNGVPSAADQLKEIGRIEGLLKGDIGKYYYSQDQIGRLEGNLRRSRFILNEGGDAESLAAAWSRLTKSTQDFFDARKAVTLQPDPQVLDAFIDRAEYAEYAKEAEQVSRLFTSLVAIGLVVPGAWRTIEQQLEQGDVAGAISNIGYTLNIILQSAHVGVWIGTGVIDTYLSNQQVVHRNDDLVRRTLRAWSGGEDVWEAIKVVHRMETADSVAWNGPDSLPDVNSPKRARVTIIMDDGTRIPGDFKAVAGDPMRWVSAPAAGSNTPKLELTWDADRRRFRLDEIIEAQGDVPETRQKVPSNYFEAVLWDAATGYRVDGNGRFLFRDGPEYRIPRETLDMWSALSAAEKRAISPTALHIARAQYQREGLGQYFQYSYDSYAALSEIPENRTGHLWEDLDTRRGFTTKEHGEGHKKAIQLLLAEIESWQAMGPGRPTGAQAYALVKDPKTFGQWVMPLKGELQGLIKQPEAPKGTYQDIKNIGRNLLATLESLRLPGSSGDASSSVPADGKADPKSDAAKLRRYRKQPWVRNIHDTYTALHGKAASAIGPVEPGPWPTDLWSGRNRYIDSNGVLHTDLGSNMRWESVDLKSGARTQESLRLVGRYTNAKWAFLTRYSSLIGSDVAGMVGGWAGFADAVMKLANTPGDAAHRMEFLSLQGEIARQLTFSLAYTGLAGAHIGLAITDLPKVPTGAIGPTTRGFVHGLDLMGSIAGSFLVLLTELVTLADYAVRWSQDDQDARAGMKVLTRQEDTWGTMGALANLATLGLTMSVASRVPGLAPLAVLGTLLLPNWSAIGRGQDLEAQVRGMRDLGRDLEAGLVQTSAVIAYRTAVPIYGLFTAYFAHPMVEYQLGAGPRMQQLLDADAEDQLVATAADGEVGESLFDPVGGTHGYLNYGVPVNMVVPLNAYLTGNGRQIDWTSALAQDLAKPEAFEAMNEASAQAMLDRMRAQVADPLFWFKEASRQRVQAELLTWKDPQEMASDRKRALADQTAYLREKAGEDRSTALVWDAQVYSPIYDQARHVADQIAERFRSPHLRVVGENVYDGNQWLGNLRQWNELASTIDSGNFTVEDNQARLDRYTTRLILAHFSEIVESAAVDLALAAIDRDTPDFGLAGVDRLLSMLFSADSASDVFVIGSRSEAYGYDADIYQRTKAYSNYSAHALEAEPGSNVEIVDFSYLQRVGRPVPSGDDPIQVWGGWMPLDPPPALDPLPDDASAEDIRLYNVNVAAYNDRIVSYNAHLLVYLVGVMERPEDQRGRDLAPPPLALTALAAVAPGAGASAEDQSAYETAAMAWTAAKLHADGVKAKRGEVLRARYLRLQNALDDEGKPTVQRFAVSSALDQVGFRFDTQFSGNSDNSVAERWVIDHHDVARDSYGNPLGTDMRVVVRDEGGNTERKLIIDSSTVDDLDQVFQVDRGQVDLITGDGDDTFVLSTTQGVGIQSGAGDLDQVWLSGADEGQDIDLDRFVGVVKVVGSEFDDVVRSRDDASHHYVDQVGVLPGSPGPVTGDDVQLTGAGDHVIEIGAGQVVTGAGDDALVVRERAGGTLDIDLGAGDNLVSFVYLPGVQLERNASTGDYEFRQVTWVQFNGEAPDGSQGTLGWGLQGTMRNVQQVIGSDQGDRMDIDGGITAINALGGDDRIHLNKGDVVVDGGSGADTIEVRGAHNTRILMDETGDLVTVTDSVQDVMIGVGTRAGEEGAANGTGVERGIIDARRSGGTVVVDVIDGTVLVKVGTGRTVINLLSDTVKVVIVDNTGRVAAGGTVEFNLLPGAPLDDLAVRTHLASSHVQLQPGSSSLLDGMVEMTSATGTAASSGDTTREHHAYQGMSLNISDLKGVDRRIDLAQALPDVEPSQEQASTVRALDNATADDTLHAWSGVRTVIDLQPGERFAGAYDQYQAAARDIDLRGERADVEAHRADAALAQADMSSRHDAWLAQEGATTEVPWNDALALSQGELSGWIAQGGAVVDRWVFNAGDLLHSQSTLGQADLSAALQSLGWSAVHGDAVAAALQGHAIYSARLGTLVVSAETLGAWRARLQALRTGSPSEGLAEIDALDATLAQVHTEGPDGGVLHPDMAGAQGLLRSLVSIGTLTPDQASIVTGVERLAGGSEPLLSVVQERFDATTFELLTGMGVEPPEGDPASLEQYYAVAGGSMVLWDPYAGGFVTSRGALLNWIVDADDREYDARLTLQRIDAELARVAPYVVTLASGEALYDGLVNDTVNNTLQVSSATPAQLALELHATNGVDSASSRLILQVDRFDGITRVGDDLMNHMVAQGDHANLLAGGREWDLYTVRNDDDVVFENANEGDDSVIGLGLSHTLTANVENLTLAYDGTMGPDTPGVLHGTGNALDNIIQGHHTFANLLDGGAGADVLWGGLGDDIYVVDNAQDVVHDQFEDGGMLVPGAGVDWVHSWVDFSLVDWGGQVLGEIESLAFLGNADLQGWGNAGDNTFRGNAGDNRFDGGEGTDTVVFKGHPDEYEYLRTSSGQWVVGDRLPGRDGADSLVGVERLYFEATDEYLDASALPWQSVLAYVASYADLMDRYGADEEAALAHYVQEGQAEGRRVLFDPLRYMASHADLMAQSNAFTTPDELARHYIAHGRHENRDTDMSLQIQVAAAPGTLTGFPGQNDALIGNDDGDNHLYGGDGSDGLQGGWRNDLLDGGSGGDRMAGRMGNDVYIVDDAADVVFERIDQGTDTVRASVSYTLTAEIEKLSLTGTGAIDGTGNELSNTLTGNSAANVLQGGGGSDRLNGGDGDDTLIGDAPNLIKNGSFEDGLDNGGAGAWWMSSMAHWTNPDDYVNPLRDQGASDGRIAMDLDSRGALDSLQQSGILTEAGKLYTLSVDVASRAGYVGNKAEVYWNGVKVGEAVVVNGTWTTVTFQVTGTGNDTLRFSEVASQNDWGGPLLDNVRLRRADVQAGYDVLDGGAGADTLIGGQGNDTYVVDNAGDRVQELANEGVDTVQAGVSHTLAINVENLVLTGVDALNGTGNALDNTLTGNGAGNGLDGGNGADTLIGGQGNDNLEGGLGTDTAVLSGQPAEYLILRVSDTEWIVGDRVNNRDGADRLYNVEKLRFEGSGQTLDVGATNWHSVLAYGASYPDLSALGTDKAALANHYLTTGHAQGRQVSFDPLRYMASNVDLMGFYADYTADALATHYIQYGRNENRKTDLTLQMQVATSAATLNGQPDKNDGLFGSAGDDQLFGGNGEDGLRGGAGNDLLDGGFGRDCMAGNAGDDTYVVDRVDDAIYELANQGVDTVRTSVSLTLGAHLENLVLTTGATDGTGNALDNALTGNAERNTLNGGAGSDTVVLDAPLSAFQFLRQSNGDVLVGYRDPAQGRADRLIGIEKLRIAATGEVIDLQTMAMPTVMDYLAANPQVVAQIGTSEAAAAEHYLGTGQQRGFTVDATFALQRGTAGDEYLNGQSGRDALFGEAGRDSLNGGPGDDALYGGAGDDLLNSADGQDILSGGAGDDRLEGGNGSDIYHFFRGEGADTVVENTSSTDQDQLVFGRNGAGEIGFNQLWFSRSGNDVIASVMGGTDSVTLRDWYAGTRVESITAGKSDTTSDPHDVRTLSATGLEQLVNTMASMSPPAGATSWSALNASDHLTLLSMGVWR